MLNLKFDQIFKILLILIGLVLLSGLYWAEIRPSRIVQQCHKEALQIAADINTGDFSYEVYDIQYLLCIRRAGLDN